VSHTKVGELLRYMGYSLQSNSKKLEGSQHADRDQQFRYINSLSGEFLEGGDPVVSIDTKKKELVNGVKGNSGTEWEPEGQPVEVDTYDFPDEEVPKAIPYGVYDVGANEGWVSVGDHHDTGAFAVNAIRLWWQNMGSERYPDSRRLLVTADAGGSNGYRSRLFKTELARFAAETGLTVTVCHYPPGTSKWNKVEHRLFSFITMNWRGRPLTSYRTIVELAAGTTTRTGLRVQAAWDQGYYPTGIKITDEQLEVLPLNRHDWHPEWNYTITPK
jgi:hypothetical protein